MKVLLILIDSSLVCELLTLKVLARLQNKVLRTVSLRNFIYKTKTLKEFALFVSMLSSLIQTVKCLE